MKLPELVAHRGYTRRYPENTLVAVEGAIRAGARYVEVDIQLSRDRVPVLFHDATLERVCGVPGSVGDHTVDELKRLRASEFNRFGYRYANVHIATLAELATLLAQHREVTAFIELKQESLTRFGIDEVLARVRTDLGPLGPQVVLISYALDALLAARRAGWPILGAVLERWGQRRRSIVREIAPQYLFCDVDDLPRFGRIAARAASVVVFEVAEVDVALRLAQRGVGFIETYAVGELRQAFDLLAA
jgi:glycerophosphoryl diester phosphodiesterase